ncbi:MAG: hypothetical protein IT577_01635 [Verrucomicrobiae bacterium]|nr:hypothetical protein [Verrucomicrobiae bacterium]
MAETVLPDIQGSLACEDVRMELNGAQTLVGVISAIIAPQLPVRLLKLCIWTRWTSGIGRFNQEARIVSPEDDRIVCQNQIAFQLANLDAHATNVHFFAGIQFDQHGAYHVEIRLDDELRLRYPLTIIPAPVTH